ncbi:hypothetical protein SSX86_015220 [Deinandra increscens subsp. villosa]|uniref:Ubiquitin-like protease family profile domain-containing protein n=1 Tax=Deinandra increscens subsp. villosa TaxID=3103831 RepID=A0AAP0GYP9_9ASTR
MNQTPETLLSDEDTVRVCLLCLVEIGFKGSQDTCKIDDVLLELVESFEDWNVYEWGEYLWDLTYPKVKNILSRKKAARAEREKARKGKAHVGNKEVPGFQYSAAGFLYPLKVVEEITGSSNGWNIQEDPLLLEAGTKWRTPGDLGKAPEGPVTDGVNDVYHTPTGAVNTVAHDYGDLARCLDFTLIDEDEHIWAWSNHLYYSRKPTERWSILPPWFHNTKLIKSLGDGTEEPYPSILEMDVVYVPVNMCAHWYLVAFDLLHWTYTVYDSLETPITSTYVTDYTKELVYRFSHWLWFFDFYTARGKKTEFVEFTRLYEDVPQQMGTSDCGVWLCMFLDRLTSYESVKQKNEDQMDDPLQYRRKMAKVFYEHRLEE